jgi:hypothetical protein
MFVAGLLNDWKRMLEEGRRRHHNERQDYEAFVAKQRSIWTPPDLFEKCCPRWLAGGDMNCRSDHQQRRHHHTQFSPNRNGRSPGVVYSALDDDFYVDSSFVRLKDGNWTCPGGCHKIHPTITLYFECGVGGLSSKGQHHRIKGDHKTVAILSSRLDPFTAYFDSRVADGSAVCKTPFYYELDGFLRENLHQLRQQRHFGSHLIEVAMGAMGQSDNAQRQHLEDDYRSNRLHRTTRTFDRLEEVLEICRLHRLSEDLDVMSIYCMQRTSNTFRKIATPIAEERMRMCQLVVTPLVDGYYVAGYSVFRRSDPDRPTVLEREHGRLVEYALGPQIVLKQDETDRGKFEPERKNGTGIGTAHGSSEDLSTNDTFSWACEELSFANLEREWGDIGVHEYVGQKVLVQWRRTDVDVVDSGTKSSLPELTIYDLGITFRGHKRQGPFPMAYLSSLFSFQLLVDEMEATQVDDVTVSFRGSATILSCQMDFRFLVAEYARSLEPYMKAKQQQIERTRPLLRRELAFMTEIRDAISMGSRCT